MESDERQDYVRQAKGAEQEEVEERIFVPTQKMMLRCDKQCSEKSLSYWHLASMVIDEVEESYATNSCQKCFNNFRKAKGEKTTDKCAVETGLWKKRCTVEGFGE